MCSSKNISSSDLIAEIFNRYRHNMKNIAYGILKDNQYAEDVVSESMIKIIKNIKMIDDIETKRCANFIYVITKNTALDLYRKIKTESNNCVTTDNIEIINKMEASVDCDRFESIGMYLKELEDMEIDIIGLKYGDGFTYKEIGLMLNMSEDAVRQKTARIRKKLEKIITEER